MATQLKTSRWSYDEFARLPSDDGKRYEIIDGELYVTPAPRTPHQLGLVRLGSRLHGFVEQHELGWVIPGPVDVLFAEGDYLEPDLVFVRKERRGIISDRGIEGPPDLVVEVLSPSTEARDRGIKRERYMLYGVPEYWVVDLDAKRIEVHRFLEDSSSPTVLTDEVRWQPVSGGPVLTISIADVLRGFE